VTGFLEKDTSTSRTWRRRVAEAARHQLGGPEAGEISEWAGSADLQAQEMVKEAAAEDGKRFRTWVHQQLRRGAGAIHAAAKRDEDPVLAPVVTEGNPSLHPQALVDGERMKWFDVWTREAEVATAPWRDWIPSEADLLPPPSPEELRAAANSFSPVTGVGCDHFWPRWFAWVSDEAYAAVAALMLAIEATGIWPQALSQSLIHLIPKKLGGTRPIAVLASFVRWWERTRRPLVRRWRGDQSRGYDWACRGRTAQAAVWRQALFDEAAAGEGLRSASLLVDLQKAFERSGWQRPGSREGGWASHPSCCGPPWRSFRLLGLSL
jgi:hypothetical protein